MMQLVSETTQTSVEEEVYVFPASFAQQRLWFLDQFEPGSPYYNIPTTVRLRGPLDARVLELSLNEIVRRHEALRTTFAAASGTPVQVISPSWSITMPVVDLVDLPPAQRETEAMRLARAEARKPFDLSKGPLLRATLVRLADREHIMLLTMHHIISDGWSVGVLVSELAILYDAFSHGRPSPLPELAIQYADFSHWQQTWLRGEVLERQLGYWKQRLGDLPPILELPADRPRPAVQTNRGATLSLKLPRPLSDAIKSFSMREGVTTFMTLLAAFKTLLHRYSGQVDISIGTPIANRNRAEIEALIGVFINTLVIRSDLAGDPTFRQLLKQVREESLGAYMHQDVPFEMLVDSLQPDRDMSHSPLFQVMFILQNTPGTAHALPDLTLEVLDVDMGTATFDLTFSLAEEADGFDVSAEYNTDIFDEATVSRILQHYQTLLAGVVADPDRRLSQLPILTQSERRQMLETWNDTAADLLGERPGCIHELFEAQVAQTPEATAVAFQEEQISYQELNRRANQLAHHLLGLGVGPGSIVGISIERSLHMVVAVLGILKAGAAYLPIDPTYPPERIAFMIQDSGIQTILTDERAFRGVDGSADRQVSEVVIRPTNQQTNQLASQPTHQAASHSAIQPSSYPVIHAILMDRDWPVISQHPDHNPANRILPDVLAYVIYTSGSTGQSKGVMISHRSLVNAYLAWEDQYRLRTEATSHLQMASFSFDVFTGDLVRALCSGGKLVLCPRELLLAPEELYALMRREHVDCAEFVPAVLRQLVQFLEATDQSLDFMRLLVCGSDSWYVSEYQRFQRICGPQTRLVNSFGLTEATIDSCCFEGSVHELHGDRLVPIGRPFANTQLYVLDSTLQPVPIGVPGELFVGGSGLAQGYLSQPALTAERFVPDPFGEGTRLYLTGDVARFLSDGNIEFLGRLDHQVKIRGFRIEPGEVEAALGGHSGIRQAVVMARESPTGDQRLIAYVVPAHKPGPNGGDLRRHLQERMADYMVPSLFVSLDALPLTPNGKVDRLALPEPDWSQRDLDGQFVAPRTPTEDVLASLWGQVLGIEPIGIYDNFFELGGHSLLATQLASRIRTAFQVDLPLRHLFESPTIATLAEQVEIAQRGEAGLTAPSIRPAPRDQEIPLSFAQQRLWFLDQLQPGSPLYNLPEAVRLTGPIDPAILEKSLNEVVRRHQALRTTFRTVDGHPRQVIAPDLSLSLTVTDLSHLPNRERETQVLELAQREAQAPFDLSSGPLVRARLVRASEDDHVLLLTMHHIIGDDWSTSILVQETAALYSAFSQGLPSPLPELPIQYADFAYWQRQWLQGEVLEAQRDYWRRTLRGLPPLLDLPTDRPRPAIQSHTGDYVTFRLSETLSSRIKHLCQLEGVTLFMTLLAAFQALLFRYSGQSDFAVGSPIANRNRADIEGLIGFFVNTLVLRADLSGNPTFRELLQRVRDTSLGAYTHQDLPFEMVVDALQPQRDLSHSPLFQVMFALQNAPMQAQSLPGVTVGPVDAHSGTAKFDLTMFIVEEEDHLSGALEYNSDLFDRSTIERLQTHFDRLLSHAVADIDKPVEALPLLSQDERQELLLGWNDTDHEVPQSLCAHQLFEARAALTPKALAVQVDEDDSGDRSALPLTYDQLNRRANQLAHFLQRQGIGPDSLVGICMERSVEMVVGLLAVLKAGGAYLPIDPAYPPERITFMIQDSGLKIMLSHEPAIGGMGEWATIRTVLLDTNWPAIAQMPDHNPATQVVADNLAYVIYTSGSTGRPKGAMITQRGLTNYLTWCQLAYPLGEGKGAPVHSSISFDLTVTSLLAPLVAGRGIVLLPQDVGVEALVASLTRHHDFSLVKITPAHLELLGHRLAPDQAAGRTRAFVIGGENLLAETLAFWQEHAPDTRLINEYGPTETVVGCCVYTVPSGHRLSGSVPIGRPVINTQLYVLDQHMEPVPIGVPGELFIGGTGVARGYLNRPSLSGECFLPDPFSRRPGARLYRTGDVARYLPDGNIEFLGRTDHQVKIHGFRIELGEIESVLAAHQEVQEVVVLAREDQTGLKRLVAYLVPTPHAEPSASQLRSYLTHQLPDYMIPAAFVLLDALPLTPNGKIDRRALPAPDVTRDDLEVDYVAPRSPAEQILADIWSKVLGIDQVGIHDNFFELGGDSILSIQVIARASQAGLRLSPRHIFEAPTVAELATAAASARPIVAEQGIVQGPAPLTPIQHWFFQHELAEPQHWNQALLLEVQQPLVPDLLERALAHLLQQHDALRLRFTYDESRWLQFNAGWDGTVPFVRLDLGDLPRSEQQIALQERTGELQASLDLTAGPLLRAAYFDFGPDQTDRLFLAVHHLAVDGISWQILLEDLQIAYEQLLREEIVRLPPKTTSFRQWAQRLTEYAQTPGVLQELEYWLAVQDTDAAELPVDFPGGANTEASARSVTTSLSAEETHALIYDVPPAYHTEVNDVLLTALLLAVQRWTGRSRLLVELEGHGREDLFDDLDISRTVGWFTSLFPVLLEWNGNGDPGQALLAVKEQLRRVPAHGIGYGLLCYLTQDPTLAARLGSATQPGLSFNYLGQLDRALPVDSPFGPASESAGPDRSPQDERTHLLTIDGGIAGGRLQFEWTFSANLHRDSTIARLGEDFSEALRSLIRHCLSPEAGLISTEDHATFGWDEQELDDILAAIGGLEG